MDLSIVIPAHNEEARIGPTLRDYAAEYHPEFGERWELLVVLNGCTDDTRRVVDEAAAECPAIRWTVEDEVLGKGAAVRAGLREATGARVAFVDADNMVGPVEARKLLDALADHDLAVGWRKPELALEPQSRPWARRVVSGISPMWSRRFLGLPVHDPQCGAKALTREALGPAPAHALGDGLGAGPGAAGSRPPVGAEGDGGGGYMAACGGGQQAPVAPGGVGGLSRDVATPVPARLGWRVVRSSVI